VVYRFSGRFALTTPGVKMLRATLMAPFQLSLLMVLAFLLAYVPASSALPSFSHSYILTTRQQPGAGDADLTVLPNGKMFFCEAAGSYVQDPQAYQVTDGPATPCLGTLSESQSREKPSAAFLQHLEDDLKLTVGETKTALLVLYVHGLSVSFLDAITLAAQFGLHFQGQHSDNNNVGTTECTQTPLPKDCILCPQDARKALFPGLLISFDWPSFTVEGQSILDQLLTLEFVLAPQTLRDTRQRATDSAPAFANIIEHVLLPLRQRLESTGVQLQITVIAHSEGNYMLTQGAQAATQRGLKKVFKDVVLLAADINSAALNPGKGGEAILDIGKKVTTYYSTSDPVLVLTSYLWADLHDPQFNARLGLAGPYSKFSQVTGIDATQATNRIRPAITDLAISDFISCAAPQSSDNPTSPVIVGLQSQHEAYRCVAETLDDLTMTMMDGVEEFPGANRRLRVPKVPNRFSLQVDNNPPLFSCTDWKNSGLGSSD
jgi:alpha/beta hydrolase family protein DUF900